ncbi:13113_t:CDS:2 [Ambispora gerdemannii]|uniref:13113_t:CDS:1 n=1 Tax=Ambispora gerdemannii TaxID=144530 RepID=A0A9N9G1Q8_9GLOM|nr:13113_t:CDS:2 [Ambispora gerdemannii]
MDELFAMAGLLNSLNRLVINGDNVVNSVVPDIITVINGDIDVDVDVGDATVLINDVVTDVVSSVVTVVNVSSLLHFTGIVAKAKLLKKRMERISIKLRINDVNQVV